MGIFKRGRIYWYHFYYRGRHIQQSTKQGNPRVARQMEAAWRTKLAMGEVGIEAVSYTHLTLPTNREV